MKIFTTWGMPIFILGNLNTLTSINQTFEVQNIMSKENYAITKTEFLTLYFELLHDFKRTYESIDIQINHLAKNPQLSKTSIDLIKEKVYYAYFHNSMRIKTFLTLYVNLIFPNNAELKTINKDLITCWENSTKSSNYQEFITKKFNEIIHKIYPGLKKLKVFVEKINKNMIYELYENQWKK